jgi:hypothetical protein
MTTEKGLMIQTAEKNKLLLKARYDATAAEGGKKAVKKIIEEETKKTEPKRNKITAPSSIHRLSLDANAPTIEETQGFRRS